mmetsp:Transcript_7308/g.32944  ORF Transcript_7308/g.32944 Transcript_7308/m.32944 type:complete len:202 (+) Transcript_7308:631-1236(+)
MDQTRSIDERRVPQLRARRSGELVRGSRLRLARVPEERRYAPRVVRQRRPAGRRGEEAVGGVPRRAQQLPLPRAAATRTIRLERHRARRRVPGFAVQTRVLRGTDPDAVRRVRSRRQRRFGRVRRPVASRGIVRADVQLRFQPVGEEDVPRRAIDRHREVRQAVRRVRFDRQRRRGRVRRRPRARRLVRPDVRRRLRALRR